jgi:hypothetical protein
VEAVKLHLAALGVKDPADVSRTLMAEIGARANLEGLLQAVAEFLERKGLPRRLNKSSSLKITRELNKRCVNVGLCFHSHWHAAFNPIMYQSCVVTRLGKLLCQFRQSMCFQFDNGVCMACCTFEWRHPGWLTLEYVCVLLLVQDACWCITQGLQWFSGQQLQQHPQPAAAAAAAAMPDSCQPKEHPHQVP